MWIIPIRINVKPKWKAISVTAVNYSQSKHVCNQLGVWSLSPTHHFLMGLKWLLNLFPPPAVNIWEILSAPIYCNTGLQLTNKSEVYVGSRSPLPQIKTLQIELDVWSVCWVDWSVGLSWLSSGEGVCYLGISMINIAIIMVTQHIPTSHIPTRWEYDIMMKGGNMTQSHSHHTHRI